MDNLKRFNNYPFIFQKCSIEQKRPPESYSRINKCQIINHSTHVSTFNFIDRLSIVIFEPFISKYISSKHGKVRNLTWNS